MYNLCHILENINAEFVSCTRYKCDIQLCVLYLKIEKSVSCIRNCLKMYTFSYVKEIYETVITINSVSCI